MLARNARYQVTITDVALVEGDFVRNRLAMTPKKVVEDNNALATRSQ
jgi:hypothetical protein